MLKNLYFLLGTAGAVLAVFLIIIIYHIKKNANNNDKIIRDIKNNDDDIIISGIKNNASLYVGLYEGIYNIARKNSKVLDSVEEWIVRTKNIDGNDAYKEKIENYFGNCKSMGCDELKNKADHFVSLIFEAGLIRQSTEDIDINSINEKEYQIFGDISDADKNGCNVIKAAWEYNGKVIEPGAILVS